MSKFTKIEQLKPHPAVWKRIINAIHWGADIPFMLKKAGISKTDWDDNYKWASKVCRENPPKDYQNPIFDPLDSNFSLDKVPAYEG